MSPDKLHTPDEQVFSTEAASKPSTKGLGSLRTVLQAAALVAFSSTNASAARPVDIGGIAIPSRPGSEPASVTPPSTPASVSPSVPPSDAAVPKAQGTIVIERQDGSKVCDPEKPYPPSTPAPKAPASAPAPASVAVRPSTPPTPASGAMVIGYSDGTKVCFPIPFPQHVEATPSCPPEKPKPKPRPKDVCKNIPGAQKKVPDGMVRSEKGDCDTPPPPPPPPYRTDVPFQITEKCVNEPRYTNQTVNRPGYTQGEIDPPYPVENGHTPVNGMPKHDLPFGLERKTRRFHRSENVLRVLETNNAPTTDGYLRYETGAMAPEIGKEQLCTYTLVDPPLSAAEAASKICDVDVTFSTNAAGTITKHTETNLPKGTTCRAYDKELICVQKTGYGTQEEKASYGVRFQDEDAPKQPQGDVFKKVCLEKIAEPK